MPLSELLYGGLLRGFRVASPLLAHGDSKLARGVRGRREAVRRLVSWAARERRPATPLVWLHAPSVGEGLQARAVLEALRAEAPDVQTVFTHFSPSAEALAARMPADVAGYLPWDVAGEVGPALDALRPSALAFTKTEVWPVLAREASARGVPCVLIAGTLPEGSSRLSPLARAFLRPAFSRLAAVHATHEEDRARFARLGVPSERVVVTGDPGIDSAAERARAADPAAPYLRVFPAERPRLVAGSTWPADEAVLLPAIARVRERVRGFEVVIAPHEPSPARVSELVGRMRAGGWRAAPLAEVEGEGRGGHADAVVVDRVGILAHLYTVASAAYVGGGFHRHGLHSVLEPAAAGVPVCFGPRHGNARAASDLLAAGGAAVVGDAAALAETLSRWLEDGEDRSHAGGAAAGYIERHRGAARRSAGWLLGLLPG